MPIIENEYLKVEFFLYKGELLHVIWKESNEELLYQADEEWKNHDLILFPFIGPDSHYVIDGKEYSCPTQHGFVRTCYFELKESSPSKITMELRDNGETLKVFPFHFRLQATYSLAGRTLKREYKVINESEGELPFQLGDHAAYLAKFGKAILHMPNNVFYYPRRNNVVAAQPISFLKNNDYLLNKDDFKKYETIIIEKPSADLKLDTGFGFTLTYHYNSPFIAIWSPSVESSFLCVEPWWGMAIYDGRDEEMRNWKDINSVEKEATFVESVTFNKI